MTDLTAAIAARTAKVMGRSVMFEGRLLSFQDLLDEGRIAYAITRYPLGKNTPEYGIILDTQADLAERNPLFKDLKEALYYARYFETPKLVTDYLRANSVKHIILDRNK